MGSTHTILTPTIIAKEALMLLENQLVMGNKVHRAYQDEYDKIGGTLTIRKPVRFKSSTGRTRVTSVITEKSITFTVATQRHVSWAFNSGDLTLSIEQYSKRYIYPAVVALANDVDLDLLSLYKNVPNYVYESTGWVTPESFIILGKAAQKLDEEAAPQNDRCIVLNPAANWSLANALKNMFVTDVSKKALQRGYLADIANFEIYMDQNVKTHTHGHWGTGSGTDGTGIEVATGAPTGTTGFHQAGTAAIALCDFDIVTTNVLNVGDIFQISGVFAVNPVSGQSTGSLRQFVVTAVASCASTGTTTEVSVAVSIDPPLIDTGPYKTISTMPAGGAAVDVIGHVDYSEPQNLAFHKNAFGLVFLPMEMPDGAVFKARETDTQTGLSIRVIKDYDISTDDDIIRLDILYGVKTLYPELACRIAGAEQA